MLGPVLASNDLIVRAYQADGVTQLGTGSTVLAEGQYNYSITVAGGYKGAIIIRLTSQAAGLDYYSEASTNSPSVPTDLAAAQLRGVGYSDTALDNTVIINITPLTDIAALKLLSASGALANTNLASQATEITNVNTAIAKLYLGENAPIIGIDPTGPSVDATGQPIATSEVTPYGLALHALSKDAALLGLTAAQQKAADQTTLSADGTNATAPHAAAFSSVTAQATVAENTPSSQTLYTAQATSLQNAPITYAIDGGRDKALFAINADTGAISFKASPDYETPKDAWASNQYEIIITATPQGGTSASQKLTIFVTDVDEIPPVFGNGPTVARLTEFNNAPAMEPIRAYAGLNSAKGIRATAELAAAELERAGGLKRTVIAVATTTGTGWINAAEADSLEYMYNGDTAIVSMQYSFLPSWLSFLVDKENARQAGQAQLTQVAQAPPPLLRAGLFDQAGDVGFETL